MKFYLFVAIICLMIIACDKSAPTTITGRWNVVSDSTIISGASVSYKIYNGDDNDYFDFASNGLLHTKEDGTDATYSYEVSSGNAITLTQTGININTKPESGTYIIMGNKARISVSPDLLNPGFSFKRIISLKR